MTEVVKTYLTAELERNAPRHFIEVPEDEAKEKLCIGPEGCGLKLRDAPERRCAGSRCMAWRWGLSVVEQTVPLEIDPNTNMVRRIHDGPPIPMQDRKHLDAYRPAEGQWDLVMAYPPGREAPYRYQREHTKRGYCGFMERK